MADSVDTQDNRATWHFLTWREWLGILLSAILVGGVGWKYWIQLGVVWAGGGKRKLGVDCSHQTSGPIVKMLMIPDPDGNHIAFAQALDPTLAKQTSTLAPSQRLIRSCGDGLGLVYPLHLLAQHLANPGVGLLFIDMGEKPSRLRVNGTASVSRDDPLMRRFAGAQLLTRVKVRAIFPNCPRYIVTLGAAKPSKYTPRPGYTPPELAWKGFDDYRDYVRPRQKTPDGKQLGR